MFQLLLLIMVTVPASSLVQSDVADMTCGVIRETGHSEEFMWDLPQLHNDPVVVEFSVYAKSEVYLALTDEPGPNLPAKATVYYIVIGGDGNTASYISRCRGCQPLTPASTEVLQCDRLNNYWLHFEDGFIKLGLRGKLEPITTYEVPEKDFQPRYLGYSSNMLSQGMFTFSFDKFGYHTYSEHVYYTGEAFCLDWFLKEIPVGVKQFCFQAQVEQGPIYVVLSPQRFRNPGEIAYEIVIGEEENSKTFVFDKVRSGEQAIKEVFTPSVLNPNSFVEYCFTFNEKVITFGPASRRDLVVWVRDESIQIKHVGFAGSKKPAQFLFPVDFIPSYYQGVIDLPPESPAGSDKCLEKPCAENGKCYVDHSFSHGYRCECSNGYTGKNCDILPPETVPAVEESAVKSTKAPEKRPTPKPDTTPPTIDCNVELGDNYVTSADSKTMQVPFSFPRAEDNADKNPYVVCVPSSNSEFPLGTSTVKCTATDKSGNEATCDFEVEVRNSCANNPCGLHGTCVVEVFEPSQFNCVCTDDYEGKLCQEAPQVDEEEEFTEEEFGEEDTTPPTIDCNVELDDNYVVSADSQMMQVPFSYPEATDNSGVNPSVVCVPTYNSEFAVGSSTVKCTATDESGNGATCDLIVVVKNSCENNPCGLHGTCVVDVIEPSEFNCVCTDDYEGDLCTTAPEVDDELEIELSDYKTTKAPKRRTTTPLPDTVAPKVTCPVDMSEQIDDGNSRKRLTWDVSAIDDVDGDVDVKCNPRSGSRFKIGTKEVQCYAVDGAGNRGECTFEVKVEDTTPPTIDCNVELEDNYVVSADSQTMQVPFTLPEAKDNSRGKPNVVCFPSSNSEFSVGTSTVKCTATDKSGNEATCDLIVEVKNSCENNPCGLHGTCVVDVLEPSEFNCVCIDDYEGELCTKAPVVEEPVVEESDVKSSTKAPGRSSTTPKPPKPDTVAPKVTCPVDMSEQIDDGSSRKRLAWDVSAIDDVDGDVDVKCNPRSGSRFRIGTKEVQCYAVDGAGNRGECTFEVKVEDTTPPTIDCSVDMEDNYVTSVDSQTMQVPFSFPRAKDNSRGKPNVVCVPSSNSEFPLGTSTVKCTATDESGNEATCDLVVEVKNSCENNPCGLHGTCVVDVFQPSEFNCVCIDDYEGELCTKAPKVDEEEYFFEEEPLVEESDVKSSTKAPGRSSTTPKPPKPDVDEGETFTTSGDSSQEIKRTLDTKVISAFEISPFDDKVSKEFQIGCEIGEFKLDVNSETFSLKNGKGEVVDSETTPETSGSLKFSIEITESAFIISYILDQDFTTLIEYSPPGREDGMELNCKAFTVKNVDKRRQRGCQIKYTKITQHKWRSYHRKPRRTRTRNIEKGETYVRKTSDEKTRQRRPRTDRTKTRTIEKGVSERKKSSSGSNSGSSSEENKAISVGDTQVLPTNGQTSGQRRRPRTDRSKTRTIEKGVSERKKSSSGSNSGSSSEENKAISVGDTQVLPTNGQTSGQRRRPRTDRSKTRTIEKGVSERKKSSSGSNSGSSSEENKAISVGDTQVLPTNGQTSGQRRRPRTDRSKTRTIEKGVSERKKSSSGSNSGSSSEENKAISVGDTQVLPTNGQTSGQRRRPRTDRSKTRTIEKGVSEHKKSSSGSNSGSSSEENKAISVGDTQVLPTNGQTSGKRRRPRTDRTKTRTIEKGVSGRQKSGSRSSSGSSSEEKNAISVGATVNKNTDVTTRRRTPAAKVKSSSATLVSGDTEQVDWTQKKFEVNFEDRVEDFLDLTFQDGKVLRIDVIRTKMSIKDESGKELNSESLQGKVRDNRLVFTIFLITGGVEIKLEGEQRVFLEYVTQGRKSKCTRVRETYTRTKSTGQSSDRRTRSDTYVKTSSQRLRQRRRGEGSSGRSSGSTSGSSSEEKKAISVGATVNKNTGVTTRRRAPAASSSATLVSGDTEQVDWTLKKFEVNFEDRVEDFLDLTFQDGKVLRIDVIRTKMSIKDESGKELNSESLQGKVRDNRLVFTIFLITGGVQIKLEGEQRVFLEYVTQGRKSKCTRVRETYTRTKSTVQQGSRRRVYSRQRGSSSEENKAISVGATVNKNTDVSTRRRTPAATVQSSSATLVPGEMQQVDWTQKKYEVNFVDKIEDILDLTFQDGSVLTIDVTRTRMAIKDQSGKELKSESLRGKVRDNRLVFTIYLITGGVKIKLEGGQQTFLEYVKAGRTSKCNRVRESYKSSYRRYL
ncbi:uncharacterized protein LOC117291459 isoform X5 [Asterias rubens]|uniref:uncharacterized protein LOC117291459 isoform X5 n=1 Tax=Asterias rubens TaxID=7604 RepID=UPI0014552D6B|nr:uncharacterized protein LOC117291459 isoform X5 [Asterias rubens]